MCYSKFSLYGCLILLLITTSVNYGQEFRFEKLDQAVPANIFGVMVQRDTLLFTGGDDLGIIDISNPSDPKLVSVTPVGISTNWRKRTKICGIWLFGDYLYLGLDSYYGGYQDSMAVVDIADLLNPEIIYRDGVIGATHIRTGHIIDSTLFLCGMSVGYSSYLDYYDIRNAIPVFIDSLTFSGTSCWLESWQNYLFFTRSIQFTYLWENDSLYEVNTLYGISNTNALYFNDHIFRNTSSLSIQITDETDIYNPFVCDTLTFTQPGSPKLFNDNLMIRSDAMTFNYDITDIFNPIFIDTLDYYHSGGKFTTTILDENDILYTVFRDASQENTWQELHAFDYTDVYNPQELFGLLAANNQDFERYSNNYILLTQTNGLYLLDISNPEEIQVVWDMFHDKTLTWVEVSGNNAFIIAKDENLNRDYVITLDMSNPLSPSITATQYIPQILSDIDDFKLYDDNLLYVICANYLYIYNISNPNQFVYINYFYGHNSIDRIVFDEEFAVLYNLQYEISLYLFSISNPQSPVFLSAYNSNWNYSKGCEIENDRLYFCAGVNYIYIFDISNPLEIELIGQKYCGSLNWGIKAIDNTLFFGGCMILYAFDVTDPQNITTIDSMTTGGYGQKIIIENNLMYFQNTYSGLFTIEIDSSIVMPQIENLDIAVSENDIELNWSPMGIGAIYYIYRSSEPYNFPGEPIAVTENNFYADTSAIQNGKWFYQVTWELGH